MYTLLSLRAAVAVSLIATYQVKQLRSQKSFITMLLQEYKTSLHVNPVQDRRDGGCINCRAGALDHPFCCVTQTLEPSEQFVVDSNFHYTMRMYMGVSSPVVHSSEWMDIWLHASPCMHQPLWLTVVLYTVAQHPYTSQCSIYFKLQVYM